jgi:hypothetical protein
MTVAGLASALTTETPSPWLGKLIAPVAASGICTGVGDDTGAKYDPSFARVKSIGSALGGATAAVCARTR